MIDSRRSNLGYNWENINELISDGEIVVCSGFVLIGVWLVDGIGVFFGNNGMGFFLTVFVAVGILCEQELMYWRTESGSGIWRVRVVGIGGRGGLFMILDVSCTLEVGDSSQESLTVEFVSKNVCDWVVVVVVCVWIIGVLLGVVVILSEEYGADGLGFDDEESSMSVSEFNYAVYSGNVWNEWVELDDELIPVDEGEGLWLSILKCYIIIYQSFCLIISFANILKFLYYLLVCLKLLYSTFI